MKRLALTAVAVLALAGIWTATATSENNSDNPKSTPKHKAVPRHCTIGPFRAFSAAVWRLPAWERGKPPAKVLAAQRRRLSCAPPGHRKAMRKTWQRDKGAYHEHRKAMLFRQRVTPFYGCTSIGGCGWWALPVGIVECESQGNYHFPYGAYSILDPAWNEWGGRTAHAGEASKREQDLVASVGWDMYGEGAWECKSDGSTSWP